MDTELYRKAEEKQEEMKAETTFYPSEPKKQAKIVNIMDTNFVLEDENGNGILLPIPHEYRKAKIGDIIKF